MQTATTMQLTAEQSAAKDAVHEWIKDSSRQIFVLAGYAGTGKSTILGQVLEGAEPLYLTPTGKAAEVLRKKGLAAQTIHSFCYQCLGRSQAGLEFDFVQNSLDGQKLVVIDEASMVNNSMLKDLLGSGRKLLFVGDHGQLPPIGVPCDLMTKPDFKLETVMRQSLDSPIVSFATHVRLGGLPHEWDGPRSDNCIITDPPDVKWDLASGYDMVLCGTNAARRTLNRGLYEHRPKDGSVRIVFLQNNRRLEVFNGQTARLLNVDLDVESEKWDESCTGGSKRFLVGFDDGSEAWIRFLLSDLLDPSTDPDLSDFDRDTARATLGYALTVHKAQGSEWDSVAVVEDHIPMNNPGDTQRWRYTAVTRARTKLLYAARD